MRRFAVICPSCNAFNKPDIMLCQHCWGKLRDDTREKLLNVDRYTADRYAQLIKSIYAGVPLGKIVISSYSHLYGSLDQFQENLDRFLEQSNAPRGQLSFNDLPFTEIPVRSR